MTDVYPHFIHRNSMKGFTKEPDVVIPPVASRLPIFVPVLPAIQGSVHSRPRTRLPDTGPRTVQRTATVLRNASRPRPL
jgi:hypothetical protein